MYVGSVSGGLITATLLKMPGTPASIITTLDGYPMASSGRASRALGLGIGASFIGGLISGAVLALVAKPIAGDSYYRYYGEKESAFDYASRVPRY